MVIAHGGRDVQAERPREGTSARERARVEKPDKTVPRKPRRASPSSTRNLANNCCKLVQSRTLTTWNMGFDTGTFVVSVKFQTYKGKPSIFNTLVPKDVRGKKLTVKSSELVRNQVPHHSSRVSYCRGIVIAVIVLDKWRGAVRVISPEVKPVCIYATGEVTYFNNPLIRKYCTYSSTLRPRSAATS